MKLVVASIDFGTTFSGWAYQQLHDFQNTPSKVFAGNWNNGSAIFPKTSTSLLLTSERKLSKFGFEAETKYAELAGEEEHRNWYFFHRFKMLLHNRKIQRSLMLDDATGKQLKALTVFSLSIKFLKDDLLKALKSAVDGIGISDIHWVLTVPAIWDDDAKQFMREAAVEAGLPGRDLTIALEPEGASLYCRLIPVESLASGSGCLSSFSAGDKYIVVDAGGGTVDISAHQVINGTELRELHRASGGPWGGTTVDKSFEQFMDDITGSGVMRKLKVECMDAYLDLMKDFEMKKRTVEASKTQTVFTVPAFFTKHVENVTGSSMMDCIKRSKYSQDVTFLDKQNKLKVTIPVMLGLFDISVKNTIAHVRKLLRESSLAGCKAIVMVGGLSDSPVLQQAMKDNFPRQKIIIPREAALAVLKGAAIFGYCPSTITERICKYTYGTGYSHKYSEDCTHRVGTREIDENGDLRCDNLFRTHARAGQTIKLGEYLPGSRISPVSDTEDTLTSFIYRSSSLYPELTTEPGCERIGQLTVPLPSIYECETRAIQENFLFGGTEILVKVNVVGTGECFTTNIDFLE